MSVLSELTEACNAVRGELRLALERNAQLRADLAMVTAERDDGKEHRRCRPPPKG